MLLFCRIKRKSCYDTVKELSCYWIRGPQENKPSLGIKPPFLGQLSPLPRAARWRRVSARAGADPSGVLLCPSTQGDPGRAPAAFPAAAGGISPLPDRGLRVGIAPARPRRSSRSFSRTAPPPPGNRHRFHFCSALLSRRGKNCTIPEGQHPELPRDRAQPPDASVPRSGWAPTPQPRGHPRSVSQVLQGQTPRENRARIPAIFPFSASNTGRSCTSQSISSPLPFLLFQGALDERRDCNIS